MSKLAKTLNIINEIAIERQNEQIKIFNEKKQDLILICDNIIDKIYRTDLKEKSNTILFILKNILFQINKYSTDISHVKLIYLYKYEEYIIIMDKIVDTLLEINKLDDNNMLILTECISIIKNKNTNSAINLDIIYDIFNTICDLGDQDSNKLKFTIYNN